MTLIQGHCSKVNITMHIVVFDIVRAFYDTLGDVDDLFYPGSSQVPYQSPFTTHKGMWRTYSNPDPHGP